MKQQHIYLVSIIHDENDNYVSTEVIQGPVKRKFETEYIVDNNGNNYWAPTNIFKKFEVVKDARFSLGREKPIVHYNIGFIWDDDADKDYVRYMAEVCQHKCKLLVFERLNELKNEIDRSIEKLIESKTSLMI